MRPSPFDGPLMKTILLMSFACLRTMLGRKAWSSHYKSHYSHSGYYYK